MSQITEFMRVRADGNLVPSEMPVEAMLARGWGPCSVIALKWTFDGKEVEVNAPKGIHAIVVPGGNYVAALHNDDKSNPTNNLLVLGKDGSVHGKVESGIWESGQYYSGTFDWFEPAIIPAADTFGVVLQTNDQRAFRCDVDACTASLIRAAAVRT